jgi:hypothetical protein
MRKASLLILISVGGLWPGRHFAQGLTGEVLLFSQSPVSGSARIQSLGFSQVALGGDISSAFSNPAGLGFFNRSEASFTPALNFNSADSYLELSGNSRSQSVSDSRAVLNFANLGVVFHRPIENNEFLKGGSFGLSISKTKDFNNRITYQRDKDNVDVDYFDFVFDKFDNGNEDTFSDLAFEAYLVDLFEIDDGSGNLIQYYDYVASDIETLDYPDLQRETRISKGSEYSVNIAYGANFGDKVYLGATIGLLTLDYHENSRYSEFRSNGSLSEFTLEEDLNITGAGINATFGIMVRPVDMLILGASLSTPNFYVFEDLYEAKLTSTFDNYFYVPENKQLTTEEALSDIFVSQYNLRTPLKFNTGASVFIGKHGFITGEVEFFNYSYNHISSDDFETVDDNQLIDDQFGFVTNYKLGAEFRRGIFRLRGGFAFFDDPRKSSSVDSSRSNITFGGGIRLPKFYVDLGIITSKYDSSIRPFASSVYNTIENKRVSALITAGFNF